MKIVILAGGTGSIAIQQGIFHEFEERLDGIEVKILVNAYDNGLSTGSVRRVMKGKILGPSDVRKNHTTRLRLVDPASPWLSFLEYRFTVASSDARKHCVTRATQLINELGAQSRVSKHCDVALEAIETFFDMEGASSIAYDDFSIANIVYAGLAAKNHNSLRHAATIITKAVGLPDNVMLNDDKSLFLGALSLSGRRILDESEIVCWANEIDPIVDTLFVDNTGHVAEPQLCIEAWWAIVNADLILLSSGTLWSSLIPTYASRGFKAAICDSKARIVMIMNRVPDKDALGRTASDIIDILVPRYFEPGRLHVLTDCHSHSSLRDVTAPAFAKIASISQLELSSPCDPVDKHNPVKLAQAVAQVFFRDYLFSDGFIFDYDDTLVGRNNECPISSRFNIDSLCRLSDLTTAGICTGNTISALDLRHQQAHSTCYRADSTSARLLVYADGGINQYVYDTSRSQSLGHSALTAAKCIAPDCLLNSSDPSCVDQTIEFLQRAGIPTSKIENRGGAVIAIRPIDRDQRHAVAGLARSIVHQYSLVVRESGRSTVEIHLPNLSKVLALEHFRAANSGLTDITYVGDEVDAGNDHDIAKLAKMEPRLKCLRVDGPAQTAIFLHALIALLEKNAKR